MKNLNYALLLCCILSCSKGGGSSSGLSPKAENLEVDFYGVYQGLLAPVNKEVSGHLNGSLTVVREKDEFTADVRLSGGPKSSLHAQSIHMGTRCPDLRDDINGDGFIDGDEGLAAYEGILIPLDDDLNSQHIGLGTFPTTDEYGYYFWSRTVEFAKLLADLKEDDINEVDDYVKLNNNKKLNLTNMVVVIKGVPETTLLPPSVAGRGRNTPHQSLPIACGIIRKLNVTPGVIDQDETDIPVPIGETIGGSSGADDGANFPTTGGTTGGTTGNYGEDDDVPETTDNNTEFGNEDEN